MRVIVFISNRCSGKSKMAMYEFLKNPTESLYIGHSLEAVRLRNPFFEKYKNRFLSQNNPLCGIRAKRIIIDEYFLFENKNRIKIYESLALLDVDEILIFSTSNKLYDRKLYAFAKFIKSSGIPINSDSVKNFIKEADYDINDLEDVCYNYITHPSVTIINDEYFFNKDRYNNEKIMFSDEAFKIECKGEFLKNG